MPLVEIPTICRYCGGAVHLVPAAKVYGPAAAKRLGLEREKFYQCQNCNARVGCHKGSARPLGNLANEALRMKRMETHQVFDSFWKERGMSRTQGYIEDWLALPENSHVARMYRRSVKGAYTIVHSWADADQGEFPSPSGVATFTDREKARAELNRLVTEEKENMEIPFSKELYREEYGNDFWEAYRDGYAAGWFTRYEIIESPLFMDKEGD